MSTYAIGDIQGCYAQLARMLERIAFDPLHDHLWVVGDLVNRGPESLRVLRLLRDLGGTVDAVLGNHDLYLLMVAAGYKRRDNDDTLFQVLEAPDRDELLHWLASRPLVQIEGEHVLVHAGLLPGWTVEQAKALSDEVGAVLAGPQARKFLLELAGNRPERWNDKLKGWDRLRVIVNACTRMRFCSADGRMALRAKGAPEQAPPGTSPWFRVPGRLSRTHTIVCGHWSALGFYREPGLIALDSGCVWGGKLTAVRIEDGEVFQVPG
ncbi:symmetrical bis(5'-nucleosyl)-tetraphosphatase [Thauera linaloolentis]|uniref:Bis(5'-nucleosyl)-tetraphosphatase, symmetrical n=1 Tax=Thauera linaloolentis (strain DSM 12138 / JCM 21573 / CCUG 41526 / CIP 105981 / IAM 15112 / NBRC 102519 / 47Lol) TaxID=1123367 RepID=N6Y482_THAL4|nr:symmetrical bis(5'-nucleosyl)-tetraphosphatase [Thauera linaloolentis]ENO86390.1 diadenosine tetraphosphatase [Thauera linaloolentis 47Lol = DSM 12138]MCM8564202.1 symmetrical bis(5'-nucleosyl)-tetraphosphatase [Thauera linaloolentis]